MHKEATLKLSMKHSSTDIGVQLHTQCEDCHHFQKEMLMKLLPCYSLPKSSRTGIEGT